MNYLLRNTPRLHRGGQKRFYGQEKIYFIVTKTFKNYPYFKKPIFCDLFIEELKICKQLKQFKLYGFCLAYDHLNLLIEPGKKYNISQVMKSLKENISRDINYIILSHCGLCRSLPFKGVVGGYPPTHEVKMV